MKVIGWILFVLSVLAVFANAYCVLTITPTPWVNLVIGFANLITGGVLLLALMEDY